jgi:molecular chaperone GrpE
MTENNPTENAQTELDANDLDLGDLEMVDEALAENASESSEQPADETEASIIEKLKAALDDAEKRALIAAADLENYRKRAAKQPQDQIKYAAIPMMTEILESVDNLNRAIDSAAKDEAGSGLLEGVKMVSDQILNILKSNNCQAIDAVGQPFDPNFHQAVQMQPSDEFPANTVMMEMRTGYRLHERVIRPSQVFVSTGPAEAKENEDS